MEPELPAIPTFSPLSISVFAGAAMAQQQLLFHGTTLNVT
jgi:hypothetical protein